MGSPKILDFRKTNFKEKVTEEKAELPAFLI